MEIKFRAWDKKEKKMISWWEILNYYSLHAMLDPASRDFDRYIVMQFTGKSDINGVDIYEKDFLSALLDFGPGGEKKMDVEIDYHIQEGYNWNYINDVYTEVIGNRYEGVFKDE